MRKLAIYKQCVRYFETYRDQHVDDEDASLMLNLVLLMASKKENGSHKKTPERKRGLVIVKKSQFLHKEEA